MELNQAARLWVPATLLRLFRPDRSENFLSGCRQRRDAHADGVVPLRESLDLDLAHYRRQVLNRRVQAGPGTSQELPCKARFAQPG